VHTCTTVRLSESAPFQCPVPDRPGRPLFPAMIGVSALAGALATSAISRRWSAVEGILPSIKCFQHTAATPPGALDWIMRGATINVRQCDLHKTRARQDRVREAFGNLSDIEVMRVRWPSCSSTP
jgi:hypothetical protein